MNKSTSKIMINILKRKLSDMENNLWQIIMVEVLLGLELKNKREDGLDIILIKETTSQMQLDLRKIADMIDKKD